MKLRSPSEQDNKPAKPIHVLPNEQSISYRYQYPETAPYALVSIQFPVYYDSTTVPQMNQLTSLKTLPAEGLSHLVNEQVVKSAYFAGEFYKYLSARLPANSVMLVPTRIEVANDGTVTNKPLSKGVPSVLSIDFYAHVNPQRVRVNLKSQGGFSNDDTFGNRLKVYTNIYNTVDPAKTELLAGTPLFNKKTNRFGLNLADYYNSRCNGSSLTSVASVEGRGVTSKLPIQNNSFFELPTTATTKQFSLHASFDESEPLFSPLWSTYSDVIISYLNQSEPKEHEGEMIAPEVAEIDPAMGKYFQSGATSNKSALDAMKASFFRVLLNKERAELFAPLSETTADELYTGEFGKSTRELLKSELNYYDKYTAAQRRKMAASLIGIAATAGSIATSITVPTYGIGAALTAVAMVSGAIAVNEGKLQQSMTQYFREFEDAASCGQRKFVMKFDNDVIEVAGDSIQSLRKEAKDRYKDIFDVSSDLASSNQ